MGLGLRDLSEDVEVELLVAGDAGVVLRVHHLRGERLALGVGERLLELLPGLLELGVGRARVQSFDPPNETRPHMEAKIEAVPEPEALEMIQKLLAKSK